jgi:hypothetical protein
MDCEVLKSCLGQLRWIDYTTLIATIAAITAAVSAFFSYKLSKKIYDEIKSDEVVVASKIQHPELNENEHSKCVLYFTLLNKSHRKVSITSLKAFDRNGNEIPTKWSDSIDELGNIQNPTELLGLKDSAEIFIRRNDGESYFITNIRIKHSFNENELALTYTP